jgi:hypothetical protein
MTSHSRACLAACAFLLVACDNPTQPPNQTPQASVQGVQHTATGGGHFTVLPFGLYVQFAFSGIQHDSGDSSGEFHHTYYDGVTTTTIDGTVTCLAFDDVNHRAWIGGVATRVRTGDPTEDLQPGDDVWFRVVDNGVAQDPPDRSTTMGRKGSAGFDTSAAYCAGKPWPAGDARTWAVTSGNITVQ